MNTAAPNSEKTSEAFEEGWLPTLLNSVAVICIVGGMLGAANVDSSGMSWMVFFAGLVNSMFFFAAASVVKSLRQIEHHTRR